MTITSADLLEIVLWGNLDIFSSKYIFHSRNYTGKYILHINIWQFRGLPIKLWEYLGFCDYYVRCKNDYSYFAWGMYATVGRFLSCFSDSDLLLKQFHSAYQILWMANHMWPDFLTLGKSDFIVFSSFHVASTRIHARVSFWLTAPNHFLRQCKHTVNEFSCIHLRAISQDILMISIQKRSLAITFLN